MRMEKRKPVSSEEFKFAYGHCINCGAVEVKLFELRGYEDLSEMGENPRYPFGSPCEVCVDQPEGFRSATASSTWRRGDLLGPEIDTEFEEES